MQEVLPPSVGDLFEEHLVKKFTNGEPRTFEYALEFPDGKREFEARISGVPDSTQVVAIIRDISERKSRETKLRTQLDELRRWHDATLGREGRVMELKQEVNVLLGELGRSEKYGGSGKEMAGDDQMPS